MIENLIHFRLNLIHFRLLYNTSYRELARRERELRIREQELARLQKKDVEEKSRRDTLAAQTKFYGDALKHSLPKMTDDPGELPAYFRAAENLFSLYEVPKNIQSKLLIPVLTDKAKSLLARLQRASLDKFEEVRDFLLREFRVSPEQCRDRFHNAVKSSDETFTLFGSHLKNLFLYYLESRKAVTKDDIIDLMVADRIKRSLPIHCLKHVLSVESDSWLKPDRLTNVIDVYMNSYVSNIAGQTGGNKRPLLHTRVAM